MLVSIFVKYTCWLVKVRGHLQKAAKEQHRIKSKKMSFLSNNSNLILSKWILSDFSVLSLVTDKMSEIFLRVVWYGIVWCRLNFVVWWSRPQSTQFVGKEVTKMKWLQIVLKSTFTTHFNQFLYTTSKLCTLAMLFTFMLHLIFLQNTLCFIRSEWITNDWLQQIWNMWPINN